MRVLFLNHTGALSGAENAMLRLLEGLPAPHVGAIACPPEGPLPTLLRERGVEQFTLSGTDLSFRLHPVETPRGLARVVRSALSLRRIAARFGADVVHANSVRAGLIAAAAHRLGGPPVVVQCHDNMPTGPAGTLTRLAVAHGAAVVVAVSDATAASFNLGLREPKAERVYISVDHDRFSPAAKGRSGIRSELGIPAGAPVLAHVAQITPWKGQDTAIRALKWLRENIDAHLLVVGDVAFASHRYDNAAFSASLRRLAEELGVVDAVHFLGQRDDVPELVGESQVLLLPSWDEPFGLAVAEAMAVGTPVVVTDRGGVREYVRDGVNGRVLPPREPRAWAAAVRGLLADDAAMASMAAANVRDAATFNDGRYADEMLAAYLRAIARSGSRSVGAGSRSADAKRPS